MRRKIVEPGVPPRLLGFALATIVVGLPLAAGGAFVAASSPPRSADAVGLLVFFGLALLAEMRPVPIDVSGGRLVSLAFVFVVAAQLLFGWQWSVLIGAAAIFVAQLPLRVAPLKLFFNSMVYSIAAGLASLPPMLAGVDPGRTSYVRLSAVVFGSGAVFVLVNVTLVCTAIALAGGEPIRGVLREHLRHSGPVFSIMVFIVAQAVIFWQLSPFLLILVGAPLFTLNLYQRSAVRGRMAQHEAETDSLTGLKNYRAYEAEIVDVLAQAGEERATVSLCLVDVDRFKQVNDRHGHPVGDAVLKLLGGLVEELAPGLGYRLGGDEFAVVVFSSARGAAQLSATLQERFAAVQEGLLPERVTLSTGIATAPDHADDPEGLKKRADLALYQSKHTGKDRSMIYDPASESAAPQGRLVFDDRIVTATRLAKIVDALSEAGLAEPGLLDASKLAAAVDHRHVSEGTHSRNVARLVESLGRILGAEARELEQLRFAGLLHDVGKIAIPDRILNNPGPLTEAEQQLVRKHPEIGFELVTGLELAPIDLWILHHHEHWDGSGYPSGLAGADIPFGSRIILVADAFDAMTTHRIYRRAISVEAAMSELQSESGRQFDPLVVGALAELLANPVPDVPDLVPDVPGDEMSLTGLASLRLGG